MLHSLQCLGRSCTVGNDKPARTKLYTTEITHHNHKHIGEFLAVYLPQDRLAGCTRRLSVVIGTLLVATLTQTVGIAHVARIVVFLLVYLEMLLYLLNGGYRNGKSKELAAFLGVDGLTLLFYGLVYILFKHCYPFIFFSKSFIQAASRRTPSSGIAL